MNKAIKNIGKYFSKFEIIEFQIDSRNEKIDFDLIEFECSIREKLRKFEKDLQLLYLEGNDLVLKRVKKELLKIEESLKQKLNVGIHFRIEETGSIHSIEPGLIDSIGEIKLKYSKQLVSIINYFLETREEELSKTDKLKEQLSKYGFFELPKVNLLSEINKKVLIDLISKNQMPYGIAMFDFLGFCEYLDNQQGTKYKANIILSRFFNEKAKDGTSAKHYRRSLIKITTPRYKAGEYKNIVQRDYEELK